MYPSGERTMYRTKVRTTARTSSARKAASPGADRTASRRDGAERPHTPGLQDLGALPAADHSD